MGKYDALMAYGSDAAPAAPAPVRAEERGPRGYEDLFGVARADQRGELKATGRPDTAEVGGREAFVRGGLQGASMGFGDEAAALLDTGISKIPGLRGVAQSFNATGGGSGGGLPLDNPNLTYAERRDAYRARNEAAEAQHGGLYTAGSLVGGLAAVPLAPGAEALAGARTLGSAIKAGAKVGALAGAASGLGGSKADLTHGEVGDALLDTAKGAGVGALTGGAVGALGEGARHLTEGGKERIRNWVVKDIAGDIRGASTATAKKALSRDAEDVADVVTADRDLETTLRKASHGGKEALGEAMDVTNDRLRAAGAPRGELYKGLDEATGGVRAGDFLDFLKGQVKARIKTGTAEDATEAAELSKMAKRIQGAEEWGAKPMPQDPQQAQLVTNLERRRAAALSRGEDTGRYDEALDQLTANQPVAFDPDHVVSTVKVREAVTDLQKTAFRNEGGINGTERFRRAREVARAVEPFLDDIKAAAAKKDPELVARLETHDKHVSALLNVKQVLEQRLNHAEQQALGAQGEGLFGRALHFAAHPKAGVVREGVALAAKGTINAGRAIDRAARSVEESPLAARVLQGVRKGLTLSAAIEAAEAGGQEATAP